MIETTPAAHRRHLKTFIILHSSFIISLLLLPLTTHAAQERFYIGTYTGPGKADGIYTGLLDSDTGRLSGLHLAAEAKDPGYLALAPDAAHLYAVTSDDAGSVSAFAIGKDGDLTPLNRVSSCGPGPCHLSVNPSGKNVLVANYMGGNIASIPINPDGTLGAPSESTPFHGSGPDPDRQKKPFAHFITTDATGQFVYACDLGTDHVWTYPYSATGHFGPPIDNATLPPGSGPRHLAFGPAQDFAYVNGEMGRNVTVFHRDKSTGALTPIQTLSVVPGAGPAKGITTAEIAAHPSGKWLYVSSRGDDIIALFAIGPDGRLTFVQDAPGAVKVPRGFGIDPSGRWLIAAGQTDGTLAVLGISQASGKLTPNGQTATIPSPICVLFPPAK